MTDTIILFGNNRVGHVTAEFDCATNTIYRFRLVITQTLRLSEEVVHGEANAVGRCSSDIQVVQAVVTPRTPVARFESGLADACFAVSMKDPAITQGARLGESFEWCGQVFLGDPIRID